MNLNKTEYLKTRCTAEEKRNVQNIAALKGTTVSEIVLSAVQAYMDYLRITGFPPRDYIASVDKKLYLNKICNTINLDPSIPDKTKYKLRKELIEIEHGRVNHNHEKRY